MTDTFPSWLEDDTSAPRPSDHGERPRRRRRSGRGRTVLALLITLLLLALLGLMVVFAVQARAAQADLRAAIPLVTQLREQALSGQTDAAAATAEELREHAGAARDAVSGPHWSLAAHVPYLGPNVAAARTATEVVDDLAGDVLPQLVSAAGVVDPARLAPQDGRIDLAPFAEVAPQVVAADEAVDDARERLATIDPEEVLELMRGPLADLTGQVDDVASLTATASRAVQLVPPMLGADEPRDYVLMVQNNAEPRSTGGLTGAFLHLRVDDGAVDLVEQLSAGDIGSFPEPVVELSAAEVALFGTQLGRYPGNVTATPDFPRSAELIRAMWTERVGGEVDGVLSLDPVVLGSMLSATGPIDVPQEALWAVGAPAGFLGEGSQLTADNAADLMLNGVYREIAEPAAQDAFFELAAAQVFSRAMTGGADPTATVAALVEAADEGRIHVWSAHEPEQALLSGTVLSGELRGDDGDGSPVVGVYVNDLSAAKIAYYQRMEVEVVAEQCHANGAQDLTVSVTLTSEVPDGAATLPASLVGLGRVVPHGDMRSNLLVYAPTGGRITGVRDPAGEVEVLPQVHDDQVVVGRRVHLSPGQSVTTEIDITTGTGLTGDPILRTTPGPGNEMFVSAALTC
ncbi:DUF4012 domain-containing protein [Georgenia sp. 311]|uniref:DUF4012 domain-containing protein n=1 Tax=Georgenia sp. 311 TaxID=2585134 RepID=UPI0011119D88|nr:DUF4012 domain-containing protein [Georgenia sp. 311]TNC19710.1 DUF4012 domain-containing protein [Georgenia sp. 311]